MSWAIAPVALAQFADQAFNPGTNEAVRALVLQPDGKILVGGDFTMIGGGGTGNTPRSYIARLNPDGTVDTGFNPGANAFVHGIALQADGKIVVAGSFNQLGGGGTGTVQRNFLGRLHADGSLDSSFDPNPNGVVVRVAVQSDGKILASGNFTRIGEGSTANTFSFARLNANGTLDTSFVSYSSFPTATPLAIVSLPGGKTAVGNAAISTPLPTNPPSAGVCGSLNDFPVAPRSSVDRLLHDGCLDPTFLPPAIALGTVQAIASQPDGALVVGGSFTTVGSAVRNRLARLNSDGSLDLSFDPGVNDGSPPFVVHAVYALAVQPDGKVLVAGRFSGLGGGTGTTSRSSIGRLNPDGSVEPFFNPGVSGTVLSMVEQPDGKLLLGGQIFRMGVGGDGIATRRNIGRLMAEPCQVIFMSPVSLPAGAVNVAYPPAALTQSGGINPVTYAVSSGALPPGLSLSSAGVLTGVPTQAGAFKLTILVTDANKCVGGRQYILTIQDSLRITDQAVGRFLPIGNVGVDYGPETLCASGGTPPYQWSAIHLPTGLFLRPSQPPDNCIAIVGRPEIPLSNFEGLPEWLKILGFWPASVGVSDSVGQTATKFYGMQIINIPDKTYMTQTERWTLGGHGLAKVSMAIGGAYFGLAGCALTGPAAPGCVVLLEALVFMVGIKGAGELSAALDPPDANFRTLARPTISLIPRLMDGHGLSPTQLDLANATIANAEQQIALIRAYFTSINRAQGAQLANETCWEVAQISTAQTYAARIADLIESEVQQRTALHGTFAGTPTVDVSAAQLRTLQNDIVANGMPVALAEFMRTSGLTDEDISGLEFLVANGLVDLSTRSGQHAPDGLRSPFPPEDFGGADTWRAFANRTFPGAQCNPIKPTGLRIHIVPGLFH